MGNLQESPCSVISGLNQLARKCFLLTVRRMVIAARENRSACPVAVPCYDSIIAVMLLDSILSPRGVRSSP